MDLEKCFSLEDLDLFHDEDMNNIKVLHDGAADPTHKSRDILNSLGEVDIDDTLSRVLSLDVPDARAVENGDKFNFHVDDLVKLDEEVTLCGASSHVDSVMSECISDGIEATDIGSLLEQYLEYEKAISPALSPVASRFPTPVPSPGNEVELIEECVMTDMKGCPLIFKDEEQKENATTSLILPTTGKNEKQNSNVEILDNEIIVDNHVTISTSTEDEKHSELKNKEQSKTMQTDDNIAQINLIENDNNKNSNTVAEYRVRNENGVVVVELVNKQPDVAKQDKEELKENHACEHKTRLKSVIQKVNQSPRHKKESRMRTRSRSPLKTQSHEFKNSQTIARNMKISTETWSSDSDEEDVKERFDCFKSERRTPMRKDDKRKRRKYSSCSDDEYDYYRYSRRKSNQYAKQPKTEQRPIRKNYEHDYTRMYKSKDELYRRSSSLRENHTGGISSYRGNKSQKNDVHKNVDEENVHERMTELATPVPYDIEHERKIGFLCQGARSKGSLERRNVYAGGIKRNVTRADLIRRFEIFGPIEKVTLHFRERGDNYAFIVFENSKDAMQAVEDGNKDPNYDTLDLCFGGRRKFVGGSYVDFDANTSYLEENDLATPYPNTESYETDFDALLAMAKKQRTV